MQGPGAGDMPTNMQSGQSAPFAQPHWTPVKTKNDLRDLYGTVAKGEILSSSICSICKCVDSALPISLSLLLQVFEDSVYMILSTSLCTF